MRRPSLCLVLISLTLLLAACSVVRAQAVGQTIIEAAGVEGGLILHIGCGDGELTAALAAEERYIVHGMDGDPANVAKARKLIVDRGLAERVTVEQFAGEWLPLVDNVVNLIVSDNLGGISTDEVQRVLAPGGIVALERDGEWRQEVQAAAEGN